jgi:hypothetical protein
MKEQDEKIKEYNKKVRKLSVDKDNAIKDITVSYYKDIRDLKKEYGIPKKFRVTRKDVIIMIDMVLKEGKGGNAVIKEYANATGKNEKWIDDVKYYRSKSLIDKSMSFYSKKEVIQDIIRNGIYDKKEITKRTLTGALTKLSKLVATNRVINELREEVRELEDALKIKKTIASDTEFNMKDKIVELVNYSKYSNVEIGKIMGCSESYVRKVRKKENI